MEYRFSKDPLFGKYCYIDTPWIAGKRTIYRIVRSGVRSNAWVEVPIGGREKVVLHDYQEDVIFVVLDTLISEDSTIMRVALKDVEIADTSQKEMVVGNKATLTINDVVVKVTPQTEKPKETQPNEPTEYEKSIFAFGELLFNKDKQEEFIKGCEALGIKAD